MIQLTSVSKPQSSFEAMEIAAPPRMTPGHRGRASAELSRSAKFLVVKGKSGPLQRPGTSSVLETVLGIDERVRILDTDLSPWRMHAEKGGVISPSSRRRFCDGWGWTARRSQPAAL